MASSWSGRVVLLSLLLSLAGPVRAARTVSHETFPSRTLLKSDGDRFQKWLDIVTAKDKASGVVNAKKGAFFDRKSASVVREGDSMLFVDPAGSKSFTTVMDAVNSIPSDKSRSDRYVIYLSEGVYTEQFIIPDDKPYITLQGAGQWNTKITWNENKGQSGSDFTDAAAQISGDYFTAIDISFENTAPAPPSGAENMQATALAIDGDMAAFVRCGFFGFQDTLYDKYGRHYFQNCFIQGSIDFIYGDGLSLYTDTTLSVVPVQVGSLTAQKRASTKEDTGFSFVGCSVTGQGYVYLARAWGAASLTVFSHTYLADIIDPLRWNDWEQPKRDKTIFYGEYENYGPGANTDGAESYGRMLSSSEAEPFQTINFIDGYSWLPQSGIGA